MPDAIIHTDGSCFGNPGPGAWAAILQIGPTVLEFSGTDPQTTNNRMEITAAIRGLEALGLQPQSVILITDSTYLRDGATKWMANWRRRGWLTKNNQPVANKDLWLRLSELLKLHNVQWKWVRGHAGDPLNEQCDSLAKGALSQLMC